MKGSIYNFQIWDRSYGDLCSATAVVQDYMEHGVGMGRV